MTGTYPAYGMSPSMSTITSTSSSITSSIPETERKSLCLRASPAAQLPHLHCAVKGAIHLLGDSWDGKVCPARGLRGRQLSLGRHLDRWELWLSELIPSFSALYVRKVREPGCKPGAVAGVEERLRAVMGYWLRVQSQRESACPWSNCPPRRRWRQLGTKSLAVGQGPAEHRALLVAF